TARTATAAATHEKAGGGGAEIAAAGLPCARNRVATRINRPRAFRALPILCDAPPTRELIQLMAPHPATRPIAISPVVRPGKKPSRCTYSPKATAMKPVEKTSCSQSAQATKNPGNGPIERAAKG